MSPQLRLKIRWQPNLEINMTQLTKRVSIDATFVLYCSLTTEESKRVSSSITAQKIKQFGELWK